MKVAIPLLVIGAIGAIVSFVGLGEALLHTVSGAAVMTSPASEQVSCRSGTYLLYVESGSNLLSTGVGSIVVTGPGGQSVPVVLESSVETISRGGEDFSGQVGFVATDAGSYRVTVRSPGTSLVVAPSFTTTASENLGWVISVLLSLLAGLAGLILLIVALVKRSAAKRQMARYGQGGGGWPPQAPPGWQGWPQPPGPAGPPGPPAWQPPPQPQPPPPAPAGQQGQLQDPARQSGEETGTWPQPSTKPPYPHR